MSEALLGSAPDEARLLDIARAWLQGKPPNALQGDDATLLRRAAHHGLLALVAHTLTTADSEWSDESVFDELSLIAEANLERSRLMARELQSVLALLAKHDIAAVPIKGPVLAVTAWGDLGLREFTDLDVLVDPARVDDIRGLLATREYRPFPQREGVLDRIHQRSSHASSVIRYDRRSLFTYHFELHRSVAPPYFSLPLTLADFSGRLKRTPFLDGEVECLQPEDELLVLCVHSARHAWTRLNLVVDLAALLRSCPDLDWERVDRLAAAKGATRILDLGMRLVADHLDVRVPQPIAQRAHADRIVDGLASDVVRRWSEQKLIGHSADYRYELRLRERRRDQVLMIARLMVQPRPADVEWLQLPQALIGLYPLLRLVRLLVKTVTWPWRRVFRVP